MIRQPWYAVNEVVRLSLMGYDNLYRVSKVVELPQGKSSVKAYGYKLINCMNNQPLTYGEDKLTVFNESLLWKVPAETYLTWEELKHKLRVTDFRIEGEQEND